MKNKWLVPVAALLMGGFILFHVAYAAAQEHSHQSMGMGEVQKIGKTGEFKFSQAHKIGETVLQPGTYRFVHRTAGDEHFVKFTLTSKPDRELREIKCQVAQLDHKVSDTSITTVDEGGIKRITRIEVRGENVAHIF